MPNILHRLSEKTAKPRPTSVSPNDRQANPGTEHIEQQEQQEDEMTRHTTETREAPDPGKRPANVIALESVESDARLEGCGVRTLGRAAGSVKTGLNHVRLEPGATGPPSHCHTLEEELFYVLEGSGTVTLGADDQHPLRPGDVVARPPATGVAHRIRAGKDGMTYLAYGTRVPGDSVYYPETGEVLLRGLGVMIDASPY
jgi:uncharacterized cupin superfamily protein